MARFSTYVAAGRHVDRTPSTIAGWVRRGLLPPPPWTGQKLKRVAAKRARSPKTGPTSPHGTESRWRAGCRCDECTDIHNAESRDRRRAERADWWAPRVQPLVDAFAAGVPYGEALASVDASWQALHRWRAIDPAFQEAIDQALMEGRRDDVDHGTPTAWREGCRCPECRDDHNATRRPHP